MAQPANTFDTYDAKGIREDLSDIIYNITPDDTPFYSACKKVKATNTLHEWQTDTLRSSAANAHIEGDDTSADAAVATVRLGNYTQIFKNAVTIADTEESVDKAGRKNEIAYQTLKIAREQKLDIEKALFENNAREAGDSTTARELAGAGAWVKTNQSVGSGGAAPTGNGTDARTDGTQAAFTQAKFDTVMESIWTNGGTPDKVYLSPFQMNIALGFTGGGNSRRNIDAASETVYNSVDVYVTPWGSVEFTPSRENRSRDVYIMQSDMWCVGVLRPTKNVGLAKTGDSTKRQVLTELTLVAKNEAANGIVADLSTS
ncbi:MAG: head protein [Phycisphaerae bacterium]|jgi:hypothetical protein|nr:head protein [Phycisphaerae bacterium]|tara:strand:- start:3223 stop:4170 length:948 start_codon:yes stop_codon:yes gene_type:complete